MNNDAINALVIRVSSQDKKSDSPMPSFDAQDKGNRYAKKISYSFNMGAPFIFIL
jgi:hypothetical protein